MELITRRLCCGAVLHVITTDRFKTNYFSLNFTEPLTEKHIAENNLLPAILLRGTERYPTMLDLNRRMDSLYQSRVFQKTQRCGEFQIFGFGCEFLDNAYVTDGTDVFEETLDLLFEIVARPRLENGVFCESYVTSEKRNLTDAILARINNKTSYAIERCREEMCRGERYGLAAGGTVENVAAITPSSLYARYRSLLSDGSVDLFYVGSLTPEAVAERVEKKFGTVLDGHGGIDCLRRTFSTEVIRTAGALRRVTEEQPVKQGKFSIGFRTGTVLNDPDYIAYALFLEVFGSSPISKLFMNVREKLSLCYYCRPVPEAIKGLLIVSSGIENKNAEKAEAEILHQLDEMKRGVISDEEMEAAVRSLRNGYREIYDSAAGLEGWYLRRYLAGRSDSPSDAAASLDRVTKDEVAAMARRLTPDTVYFMRGTATQTDDAEDEE